MDDNCNQRTPLTSPEWRGLYWSRKFRFGFFFWTCITESTQARGELRFSSEDGGEKLPSPQTSSLLGDPSSVKRQVK